MSSTFYCTCSFVNPEASRERCCYCHLPIDWTQALQFDDNIPVLNILQPAIDDADRLLAEAVKIVEQLRDDAVMSVAADTVDQLLAPDVENLIDHHDAVKSLTTLADVASVDQTLGKRKFDMVEADSILNCECTHVTALQLSLVNDELGLLSYVDYRTMQWKVQPCIRCNGATLNPCQDCLKSPSATVCPHPVWFEFDKEKTKICHEVTVHKKQRNDGYIKERPKKGLTCGRGDADVLDAYHALHQPSKREEIDYSSPDCGNPDFDLNWDGELEIMVPEEGELCYCANCDKMLTATNGDGYWCYDCVGVVFGH